MYRVTTIGALAPGGVAPSAPASSTLRELAPLVLTFGAGVVAALLWSKLR